MLRTFQALNSPKNPEHTLAIDNNDCPPDIGDDPLGQLFPGVLSDQRVVVSLWFAQDIYY